MQVSESSLLSAVGNKSDADHLYLNTVGLLIKLYEELKAYNTRATGLDSFILQLGFLYYADAYTILPRGFLRNYLTKKTKPDGSDLADQINVLLTDLPTDLLNQFTENQLTVFKGCIKNHDFLKDKVNTIITHAFIREAIIAYQQINWKLISPSIFGSLFQGMQDVQQRRNEGIHYTSEENILKLLNPLFLDQLWAEYKLCQHDTTALMALQQKISSILFLDPACGAGNFLITAFNQMQLIEKSIDKKLSGVLPYDQYIALPRIRLEQFYGIELDTYATQLARLSLFLTAYKNKKLESEDEDDLLYQIEETNIFQENALQIDWQSLLSNQSPEQRFHYIFGNPPFVGKSYQSSEQKEDLAKVNSALKGAGVLDYVAGWFCKGGEYLKKHPSTETSKTVLAFVSSNSIAQGEQVGILWNILFSKYHLTIHFAYQSFIWERQLKNAALVHVVIIGFADFQIPQKKLFCQRDGQSFELRMVKNINPYLVPGNNLVLLKKKQPFASMPTMNYGSMPNDGGHLLLNEEEKNYLLMQEPDAAKFLKKFVMGDELLYNIPRYCIWLEGVDKSVLQSYPYVRAKVNATAQHRKMSVRNRTQELDPMLFMEIRQPSKQYIALPRVSSEFRKYIPLAILDSEIIAGDKIYTIETDSLYVFGILSSSMHMSWMRFTSGKLESRYSYSSNLTYNHFPWPFALDLFSIHEVESAVRKLLAIRLVYPNYPLAKLYDPQDMPQTLLDAQLELDSIVDGLYSTKPIDNEEDRMAILFQTYERYL